MTPNAAGDAGSGPVRPRLRELLVGLAFWVAGMLVAHGPMILSGLGQVQGNLGAPRMLHYILEHEYRWLTGDPLHRSFWDPPIFHPARNTAAYSETLAGVAPFYAVWRVVGVPADAAYPLWMLAMSSLNFLAAFLFLRRAMDRTPTAAGFGAFLFSFASMRMGYIGLTQLLPGFYLVVAVHALVELFREPEDRKALRWIALFAAAFVGQAYTCFYMAWFLGLGLLLALAWSLALPSLRPQALAALRLRWKGLAASLAAIGIALLPFVLHSLKAVAEVGYREYDEVEMFLPTLPSWFYFGPAHWLYGWTSSWRPFEQIPARNSEHMIGLGWGSTVMAVLGLWSLRKTPTGRIFGAVAVTLMALTLLLPGRASLWGAVFLTIPGAGAIRAVGRVSLAVLLPASVGAAAMLDLGRWRKSLLMAGAVLSMLEQGRTSPAFDRREARDAALDLARRVDPGVEAFYYSTRKQPVSKEFLDTMPHRVHVDAMMASLDAGVPTINGYSGWAPPGWDFESLAIAPSDSAEAAIETALQKWCRERGVDRRRVQWIKDGR